MAEDVPLYDRFSADYDVMVDWTGRLEREWPFFEAAFQQVSARRLLDVGCGTGGHAVYFARRGLAVVGADPSEPMLRRAEEQAVGVAGVSFVRAGFGELRGVLSGTFDVVTCLGNTLPHTLGRAELFHALDDIAAVLRPGGLLVAQLLNYDRICARRQRFLGVSSGKARGEEVLFFRFYDFEDPLLTFNVVVLRRKRGGPWTFHADATRLRPVFHRELAGMLSVIGFGTVEYYGDFQRTPFDQKGAVDLIVVAMKLP